MSDRDPQPEFQVRDRRRRAEEPSPEPPAPEAPAAPRAPEPARAEPSPSLEGAAPPERSLVGLFMMLGSFAVAALEGVPDPATGKVQREPGQAAELIDLLALLREKTEGRRTAEESQALDDVIYELQLRYVRAVGRP